MNYAHDKVMLKTQDSLNRRHTHCYNSPNQALQCRAMHVNTCYMRNLTTWHCLHSSIATRQRSLRKSCKAASMAVSPRDNSFPSKWQTKRLTLRHKSSFDTLSSSNSCKPDRQAQRFCKRRIARLHTRAQYQHKT